MEKSKLGFRGYFSIILFGLFGQLAWVIENMYFNVFLYDTISGDTSAIAWMVAASAAVATLTTMFMGALSDKVGKRKVFITAGYILWGLSTLSFGFISVDNVRLLIPGASAITVAVILVIVMDCVMTFFGSTANDGAFNAWVTDTTDADNRGKVEGILATLPLIALLIIFGAFDGLTKNGQWPLFFYIIGGLVTLGGIAGIFLIKEKNVKPSEGNYWKTFFYGFRPKTIKENAGLYLALTTMCVFSIAYQVFMPYFIVYFNEYLKIDYIIILASVLLGASIVTMIVARFTNAKTIKKFFIPSLALMIIGLLGLFFLNKAEYALWIGIAGFVMMSGNLIFSSVVSAKIRNLTPADKVGHFQGIRMIFYVLIPMIIGPAIGSAVIKGSGMTYINQYNQVSDVPTPVIFLTAAIAALVVLVPLLLEFRAEKKNGK